MLDIAAYGMFFSIYSSMAIQNSDGSTKTASATGGSGKTFEEQMKKSGSNLLEKKKPSSSSLNLDANPDDEPNPNLDRLRTELEAQP